MDTLIYIALMLPAALMILAGLMIGTAKRDTTITSHHFAQNFNIKKYTSKVLLLFTLSGIMFSLSGLVMIKAKLVPGIILLIITLIVFFILFARLHKKQ